MFDVRRLVVFQEVARCGSLSAAAAALNYTTSAVSQQIAALEREVGAAVLIRGPAGARPTPAGEALLTHAADILGAAGAATRAALAAEFLPEFGVSTECGLGRHSAEQLEAVLVGWQEYADAREPALVGG